jgi:hypothetical protein
MASTSCRCRAVQPKAGPPAPTRQPRRHRAPGHTSPDAWAAAGRSGWSRVAAHRDRRFRDPGRVAVHLRHGRVPDGSAGAGPHGRDRAVGGPGDEGGPDNRLHRVPDLSRPPAAVGGRVGCRARCSTRSWPNTSGVSLGRLEEAEALLDRLEHRGRTLDRPWAIATAGRGRGLLTAARGDLSGARSALEQALVEHRRVPQPFELARTLLVKGEVERRAKQKRAARSTLERALDLFLALGAPLWAQRARDDLARVGGAMCDAAVQRAHPHRATDRRAGRPGEEEPRGRRCPVHLREDRRANLSRIFHKLGVRSRTELTRRLAQRVSPDSSPLHRTWPGA